MALHLDLGRLKLPEEVAVQAVHFRRRGIAGRRAGQGQGRAEVRGPSRQHMNTVAKTQRPPGVVGREN
ncbi:MAG: hypothetical protein IH905_03825, partial [Proteobacteria bacterium]|nr:hypothetical protein [Pseudomonadota bacterium]